MKHLIILCGLIISTNCFGQLFLTLEPQFMRPGMLYNILPKQRVSPYVKAWWGDIKGKSEDGQKFYTQNIKTGIGVSIQDLGHRQEHWTTPYARWYVGMNYNYFYGTIENQQVINLNRVHKLSFDVGISVTIRRFTGLMMTDPLNWESMVGVSYKLSVKSCGQ